MTSPEAGILAVALTRYADACPPTLHPDCPFAVTEPSGRTCQKECRDEVIRLQRPGHSSLTVFSGPLFDARQTLLTEKGHVPEAAWHTASLILRLDEALRFPPRGSDGTYFLLREIDITNALAYLAQRGIDPDWLVRFGLGQFLPLRIVIWVGDQYLNGRDDEDDFTDGWLGVAGSFMQQGESFDGLGPWLAAAQATGFRAYIEKWVKQAPLEDIWAWRPSSIDSDLVVADDNKAGWVVDRFRRTYLSEWAEASLHHEYRYLQGRAEAPIPISEMKRREVPSTSLSVEMADRATKASRSHAMDVM